MIYDREVKIDLEECEVREVKKEKGRRGDERGMSGISVEEGGTATKEEERKHWVGSRRKTELIEVSIGVDRSSAGVDERRILLLERHL